LDLHLGDSVLVEKGGEIIPKIIAVNTSKRDHSALRVIYPEVCPECKTSLIRKEGEAVHYCPNDEDCPPQIVGKIQHFIGRKAMNIDGLGDETIESFYKKGFIVHISDLYTLYEKEDLLKQIDRFGEKSISNMLEGIEKSKQMPFEKVLFGLGIRYVGETVAKKLAAYFKNIDSLMNANFEELVAVEEIGERIAESLIEYIKDPRHKEQIEQLRSHGLQFESVLKMVELESSKLEGKSFIISGVFENYSRDELKDIIEANSGKIVSSISAKLNYLVAGDNMGPAKLEKATKLQIPIISDNDLIKMLQ
jgi:DNA ligase (NAD+)